MSGTISGLHPRGLSPRMRGNHVRYDLRFASKGSIPAHAGEPNDGYLESLKGRVYPRACGGTQRARRNSRVAKGLSPRMRGNQLDGVDPAVHHGSIPAHAGEPGYRRQGARPGWVYPRACGGTQGVSGGAQGQAGLSPRMRGNPRFDTRSRRREWVYPRACGGTRGEFVGEFGCKGLSPRMRGNLLGVTPTNAYAGSIPAHAGEPRRGGSSDASLRVYPRACGGTRWTRMARTSGWGLSPRMRGNRGHPWVQTVFLGSIPAHAGEPPQQQTKATMRSVGLSPRMRGNLWCNSGNGRTRSGSIPAHAGEPARGRRLRQRCAPKGLSPRMRGNLWCNSGGYRRDSRTGSIPAHAGEPIQEVVEGASDG